MNRLPELFVWGIQDSLNPFSLAVWAWFIWVGVSACDKRPGRFLVLFPLFYLLFSWACLVGLTSFVDAKFLDQASRVFFTLIGGVLAWRGVRLLVSRKDSWPCQPPMPGRFHLSFLGSIIGALVFAFFAQTWPPTSYLTVLANDLLLPGKYIETGKLLLLYSLFKAVVIILTAVVIWDFCRRLRSEQWKGSRSMVSLMLSAVFLSTGAGVIWVCFKQFGILS